MDKFVHRQSGFMGSPAVCSSSTALRAGTSSGVQLIRCFRPPLFFSAPLGRDRRKYFEVGLALPNSFGIAAEQGRDEIDSAMAEFFRLDSRVTTLILLAK